MLLFAAGAFAQPAPTATPQPVFYETTTVVTRSVESATGSISVIDAGQIEAAGARSVAELLRGLAGVTVVGTAGRAGVTFARLRGGDPNFTLVLLDGLPLNDSTETQGGAVNLEELSTASVERVELVRGPLGAFYGVTSLSGVVQLFSRRGQPGPLRLGLRGEVGNASLRGGAVSVAGAVGRGGYAGGVGWSAESGRVGDDRFRQLEAHAGASLVLGPQRDLRLRARLADGETDDYLDGSGGPLLGSGLLRHGRHRSLTLGAELDAGDPAGRRHRLLVGFARRTLVRANPALGALVPNSDEDTAFERLRLAWQVPFRRTARTAVELGASAEGEWGRNESLLHLPPAFGGDVRGDYNKTRVSGGGYAELRRLQGSALFELALRADTAGVGALQANPRLGVVWRPRDGGTRLRLAGGRSSKLPSFFALASPAALGGNPELRAEHALGAELGLERSFRSAGVEVGTTVFVQDYRDLVDFDFDLFAHVNRSRVRVKGAELSLAWSPRAALALDASASWLDAHDVDGGVLRQRPRWSGRGHVTWRPAGRVSLRVDGIVVSRYLDRQVPVPERDSVAGYGLLGASAFWQFAPGWTLRARGDNLVNRRYETYIGFPGARRSFWLGCAWETR